MSRRPLLAVALAAALLNACGGGTSGTTNRPPSAQPQSTALAQGASTPIALPVADPDGDPLTVEIVTPPSHGNVTGTSANVTYTPASDFIGVDTFTYRASDGQATSATATVTVKVYPATGPVVPGGAAIDAKFVKLIDSLGMVGGASVAISKDGKLIYARGFGYADPATRAPFQPDALSRIASTSKMLTMAAVMHLVEGGALSLDNKLLDLLPVFAALPPSDPRTADITVRHLLSHAAGWDWTISGDPIFMQARVAADLGVQSPATCAQTFRWTLGRRLDFTPGTGHAYANIGFCALALVVEQVSGQDFQTYVRDVVLAPMGIHDMRFGASHWADRAPGEVTYSSPWSGPSVFPGDPATVPQEYGVSMPHAMGAGAWIGSAIDLTRFLNGVEGRGQTAFLSASSIAQVSADQWTDAFPDVGFGYGLGLLVRDSGGTRWWGHPGALGGTRTSVFRSDSGWAYAAIFNSTPIPESNEAWVKLDTEAFGAIVDSIGGGFTGSPTNLYPLFPSAELGPYWGP
jgi:CubicO group peptidase (beta-lactamase class C family)